MGNAQKKLGFSSSSKKAARDSRRANGRQSSRSIETQESLDDLLSKGPIEDHYEVNYKVVLGRGHYATVNLGTCKRTGRPVAVKRIAINKSRVEALQREVQVLRKVGSHPNIVSLHDIFIADNELQLVLELLKGGELFDRMVDKGPYSEREASHHIRKIGLALKFLHRNGIVHRDLKPENLILADKSDDAELKIADFGLSKLVDDVTSSTMSTVCGTWAYCAPEVKTSISASGPNGNNVACYTASVDLWSVGVILFVILAAYHPFDPDGDASDATLWENICRGDFDFDDPAWDGISNLAKDLIRKLIVVDPTKRLTTDQLLQHPWVAQTASVPSTPITPKIDSSLKGFVKHRKAGMTPKAGMPVLGNPTNFANNLNPGQHTQTPHPYATRSQLAIQQQQQQQQNTNGGQQVQSFGLNHAHQPPQPVFGQKAAVPVLDSLGNYGKSNKNFGQTSVTPAGNFATLNNSTNANVSKQNQFAPNNGFGGNNVQNNWPGLTLEVNNRNDSGHMDLN